VDLNDDNKITIKKKEKAIINDRFIPSRNNNQNNINSFNINMKMNKENNNSEVTMNVISNYKHLGLDQLIMNQLLGGD
jgi:hypothetical protein